MADVQELALDPHGDVLLVVGEDNGENPEVRKLRVSSVILSHGSPVFKAMLVPRFREGLALASTSTVEIPLPDDDASVMHALCSIMHMRHDLVHFDNIDHLLRFTEVADKYGCAKAVQPVVRNWVTAGLVPPGDYHDNVVRSKHLRVACVLKDDQLLNAVARDYIMNGEKPSTGLWSVRDAIPADILASLELKMLKVKMQITEFVGCIISGQLPTEEEDDYDSRCRGSWACTAVVLQQLAEKNLWPPDVINRCRIGKTLERLDRLTVNTPYYLDGCPSDCRVHNADTLPGTQVSDEDYCRQARKLRDEISRFKMPQFGK